jgi:hypothetical protein
MLDALLFSLILAVTPADKSEPPPKVPSLETQLPGRYSSFIYARTSPKWRQSKRVEYAVQLGHRIEVEARRRGLDANAMVAIGWIESHFQPWARGRGVPGRREGEIGTWQLFRGDQAVEQARLRLAGCNAPAKMSATMRQFWDRRKAESTERCEAQEVADARRWHAHWLRSELEDVVVSTFIVGLELRMHLDASKAAGRTVGKLPSECSGVPEDVTRMAFYNSGPRPPTQVYLRRLCHRFKAVKAATSS